MAAQKSHLTYNEVVASVPFLAQEEQLGLLQVLSSVLIKTVSASSIQKHSLLELEGLGAGLWTGNVEEYIQTERDAWN